MAFGKLRVDEIETSTQTVSVDAVIAIGADGDKGDITVSGAGTVWTIDDGAVDTAALGGDITAAGKALLDDADAAAQRTTLGAEAAGTAASTISTHEAAADPHPGYALESSLATVATTGAYSDLTGTPALVANLDDLGDVDLTTTPPADGEALVYDSATGDWVPGAAAAQLGDLTDVVVTTPSDGQVLEYDSATSRWINATPTGGGGTPGGTTGQIQWNSAGSFAGVGGSSVGATGDITLSLNGAASTPPLKLTGTWFSGGTGTTTKPQLLIEPTGTTSTAWSTSGTGLGVNAASGFAGNLLDLQVNGSSKFKVENDGHTTLNTLVVNAIGTNKPAGFGFGSPATSLVGAWSGGRWCNAMGTDRFVLESTSWLGFSSLPGTSDSFAAASNVDARLYRDAAGILAQRNGTNAQTLRVYGTYTDLSNHVRGSLSATSTAVTLAAETAGTGADDIPLNLTAAGTGTVKVNSVAEVAVSSTVAGLPATPAVGMLTRVTDANVPAVGFTVAGGGAAAALVWWNGSNWTVIGV